MKCWQNTWSEHTACQCYYMAVKHGHYHPVFYKLNVSWNNCFRRIFNGFWRESVKPLLFYCNTIHSFISSPQNVIAKKQNKHRTWLCPWCQWLTKDDLLFLEIYHVVPISFLERLEDYVTVNLEHWQLSIISTVFVLVTGTISLLYGVVL